MKNKKLLVSLAIVAALVVFVVIMVAVFSVKGGYFVYHKFDGGLTMAPDGGVPAEVIEKVAKGKSTIFMSKTKLLAEINSKLKTDYPDWRAFAVVKNFPNVLEIHLVKRTAIAKFQLGETGEYIYIDSFGCQVYEIPQYECVDISSAFKATDKATEQPADGTFRFESAESNMRLTYVLQAIMATWQCNIEIEEMNVVLDANKPFEFDSKGSLLIHPSQGGTIELQSPDTDLAKRVHKAYGVYYNSSVDLQSDEWVITVYKNGRIKTPDPNKK